MAEGEFALVRQHLEQALTRTSSWVGDHDLYAMLADAAGQQRDEPALARYTPLAEAAAARYDHPLYQAMSRRARGVLHRLRGEHAAAAAQLRQALELFSELGARSQVGRTHGELAALAVDQHDLDAAREHYRRALAAFEALGAAPDAARTREALAGLAPPAAG